jgi:hypothetical protein
MIFNSGCGKMKRIDAFTFQYSKLVLNAEEV